MLAILKQALLLTVICSVYYVNAQTKCDKVGDLNVFLDQTCSTAGGAGCNAGGQGQNCRFCGFDVFPKCPSPTNPPTTTKATTKTTTKATTKSTVSTESTTKKSTTRDPNKPTAPVTEEPEEEAIYNEYGEKLIFSDDFEFLDYSKWKHDLTMSGGGNWEFQLYHNNRTNSHCKDGKLFIHPTLTEERIGTENLRNNYRMDMWGGSPVDQCTGNNFYGCERLGGAGGNILNPIQSAKLTTVNSFSVKYGRVEVVAKLPKGDWLWPAIWMLPATNPYGMWPASGEIDIMEGRGNVNYNDIEGGLDTFGSTLHWGVDWTKNRYHLTHAIHKHSELLSDDFHTYGLHWTADRLYTYFDDPSNVVMDVDLTQQSFFDFGEFTSNYENPWATSKNINAPFDKEFYLIINLAVGGTAGYFKDGVSGKPWTDKSSNSVNEFYAAKNAWWPTWQNPDRDLVIDSVKVWKFDE